MGLHEREGDEAEEGRIKLKGAHGEALIFLASTKESQGDVAFPVGPYVITLFDRLG
jgi:hypothetical protein